MGGMLGSAMQVLQPDRSRPMRKRNKKQKMIAVKMVDEKKRRV